MYVKKQYTQSVEKASEGDWSEQHEELMFPLTRAEGSLNMYEEDNKGIGYKIK